MDLSQSQATNLSTSTAHSSEQKKSPWINAWRDVVFGAKAYSQGMLLSDIRGDGDHKLLVGAMNKKLIAYKGSNLDWESPLLETPNAIATFYSESAKIPQPCIAVASESSVYLYKNLKPYYKYALPAQEWRKEEVLLWNQYTSESLQDFINSLNTLKSKGINLSDRAYEILSTNSTSKQQAIIHEVKSGNLSTPNTATCMDAIKKTSEDETAVSHLIIGTENKELIIMDQLGTAAMYTVRLPGIPAFLDVSGVLDGEHQILVITREAKGFVVRNGELTTSLIEFESKACALARVDRTLYIGLMDQSLQAFNLKTFRRQHVLKMPDPITNMETMEKGRSKSIRAYLVALLSKEIRMYNDKQLLHSFKCEDVVAGMRFGVFGREDGALVILYNSFGLDVKILQRQFNMSTLTQSVTKQQEEDVPLNMPKKTKLFIEQSQRERDQYTEMYRTYMKDLFRMRLKIAQNYIKGLKEGITQVSGAGAGVSVRIHALVEGIGPLFKIKVEVENLDRLPAYDLKLSYAYDRNIYKLYQVAMDLPVLIPGLPYPIEIMVESIDPNGTNDNIKIFVLDKNKSLPVVTAVVNMPVSEINVD